MNSDVRPVPFDLTLLRLLFTLPLRGHRIARALWKMRLQSLGSIVFRTKPGFEMIVDPLDQIAWAILMHREWEPDITALIRAHLTSSDFFLDIGANYGWHSLNAAISGAQKVVAYEPQAKLCRLLHASFKRNNFATAAVRQAAVSDQATRGVLHLPRPDVPQLATVEITGALESSVKIVRLDDEFTDESSPSVIKIDAEGHEVKVLRGMRRLLATGIPRCFVIEAHPPLMKRLGDDAEALYRELLAHGLRVFLIKNTGEIMPVEDPMIIETASIKMGCCNIFAIRN